MSYKQFRKITRYTKELLESEEITQIRREFKKLQGIAQD